MQKLFRISGLLVSLMMVVWIVGCGEEEEAAKPGMVTNTTPAEGGTIAPNGTLTVVFDNAVTGVTAAGFAVDPSADGITWTLKGQSLKAGALAVSIAWKNKDGSAGGPKAVNLKVGTPDTAAPKIAASSPKDGESGVDPAKVTKLTVTFDEDVAAVSAVKLAAVGGDALQVKGEAKGKDVEVTFLGGAKLSNETKYELTGKAKDGSGNEGDFKVTFETMKKQ